ncbi:hypothetical protein BJX63DRAFT_407710 [Aspergillus granulosus]|uniref:DUF6594 domain-containing protein n=1 Tax=Aspergillus granulosus TaxID=176169 RepID=A0ABR4H088_9EURO
MKNATAPQVKRNIERGLIPRDGYPGFSSWISEDADHEGFIFRRFSRLSARNLLNLQSQLIRIEQDLEILDKESRQILDVGLRRWETFEDQAKDPTNKLAQRRRALYDELEIKMKGYHEALVLQSSISNLRRPRTRVFKALQNWFSGGSQGKSAILNGRAATLLDDPQDLVALRTPADEDVLSRSLQDHWPFPGREFDAGFISHFQERHVVIVVAVISVITSASLLVGAIVSLYIVQEPKSRLAMIAGFTALFAISVTLMTNARRAEVFAATAAYAAVLVVFVSGNLG